MNPIPTRRDSPAFELVLRALFGALIVMVGLWLIPEKDSDTLVLVLAWLLLPLGGWIAGWKVGWVAVPAGVWLTLATYSATDCADCHSGGEQVAPRAVIFLGFTAIFATMAFVGGAAGFFYRRGRVPVTGSFMVAAAACLFGLFVIMATVRWAGNRESSGDVVFASNGIRYRAGGSVGGPERRIQEASANLNGDAPVWLGDRLGPFNLSRLQSGAGNLLLVYGKCGPAPCSAPVTVMMRFTCGQPPEVEFAESPPMERVDGVVMVSDPVGGGDPTGTTKAVAWTGHLEVTIYAHQEAGNASDLVQQLQRVDGQPLEPAKTTC